MELPELNHLTGKPDTLYSQYARGVDQELLGLARDTRFIGAREKISFAKRLFQSRIESVQRTAENLHPFLDEECSGVDEYVQDVVEAQIKVWQRILEALDDPDIPLRTRVKIAGNEGEMESYIEKVGSHNSDGKMTMIHSAAVAPVDESVDDIAKTDGLVFSTTTSTRASLSPHLLRRRELVILGGQRKLQAREEIKADSWFSNGPTVLGWETDLLESSKKTADLDVWAEQYGQRYPGNLSDLSVRDYLRGHPTGVLDLEHRMFSAVRARLVVPDKNDEIKMEAEEILHRVRSVLRQVNELSG
jgi:hypothetical protein